MMPAGWTHAFINDFHQTVLGLRTAQTGRAYTHLDALLFRLSDQLKHASTKLQHQLLPVVQRMIWAKEQENELLLADIVEYELPLVMPECFIDVSLMTLTTIDDLLTIEEDATELVADAPQIAALRQLYEDHPAQSGIGLYLADQLRAKGRDSDARRLLETDRDLHRMSPQEKYALACIAAREGDGDAACRLMTQAYADLPDLQNGFLEVAWLKAADGDWPCALAIAQRDESAERVTPSWQPPLASLYAHTGQWEHAAALIESAYAQDADLTDGFSMIGAIHAESAHWQSAIDWYARDLSADRLSPAWRINLALIEAKRENLNSALAHVNVAYDQNAELLDAYARLGWLFAEQRDWARANEFMSKDREQGRLSPFWMGEMSIVAAHFDQWKDAADLVQLAYASDPELQDCYARIGWFGLLKGRGSRSLTDGLNRDLSTNRTGLWHAVYGACFDIVEARREEAITKIEKAYEAHNEQMGWFCAIGWLQCLLGDLSGGIELIRRDLPGKVPPEWRATCAVTLAAGGLRKEAFDIIQKTMGRVANHDTHLIGFWHMPSAQLDTRRLIEFLECGTALDDITDGKFTLPL